MKKKLCVYTEAAYLFGILFLAIGTAFVEKAGFGMSMVVAPAYLVYLKCSQFFSFVTFGMGQYIFQGLLIILTALVLRRFKLSYLFSFVTAVIYGLALDVFVALFGFITADTMVFRIIYYIIGVPCVSLGVAFMFHTYLAPEAYEMVVKEISEKFSFNTGRCKTVYDLSSLLLSVIMSFAFFGFGVFKGVGVGTVICALVNGTIIGLFGNYMDKHWVFKDRLKLREYF